MGGLDLKRGRGNCEWFFHAKPQSKLRFRYTMEYCYFWFLSSRLCGRCLEHILLNLGFPFTPSKSVLSSR